MALDQLKTQILTYSRRNAPFALSLNEMASLDSSVNNFNINTVFSLLASTLPSYSVAVVRDKNSDAIMFIPNTKSAKNLVTNLAPSSGVYQTPITVQEEQPASYTRPVTVSSVSASIAFTGNSSQMLVRPMITSEFQSNYISFWLKGTSSFNIGTYNSISNPVYSDVVRVTASSGRANIYIIRSWNEYNKDWISHDLVANVPLPHNIFSNIVVGLGADNYHCYVNGSFYTFAHTKGNFKPRQNLNGYFVIGPQMYKNSKYASLCSVKNICLFSNTQANVSKIDDIVSYGDNGDVRTFGISPKYYWRLNGDTSDTMSSTPLSQGNAQFRF